MAQMSEETKMFAQSARTVTQSLIAHTTYNSDWCSVWNSWQTATARHPVTYWQRNKRSPLPYALHGEIRYTRVWKRSSGFLKQQLSLRTTSSLGKPSSTTLQNGPRETISSLTEKSPSKSSSETANASNWFQTPRRCLILVFSVLHKWRFLETLWLITYPRESMFMTSSASTGKLHTPWKFFVPTAWVKNLKDMLAKLFYASPAWWGFTTASEKHRIEAYSIEAFLVTAVQRWWC